MSKGKETNISHTLSPLLLLGGHVVPFRCSSRLHYNCFTKSHREGCRGGESGPFWRFTSTRHKSSSLSAHSVPPSRHLFLLYYNYISRMKALDRTTRRPNRATCDPTSYLMIGTQQIPPLIAIHPCSYQGTNDDILFCSIFFFLNKRNYFSSSVYLINLVLFQCCSFNLGQRNELSGRG